MPYEETTGKHQGHCVHWLKAFCVHMPRNWWHEEVREETNHESQGTKRIDGGCPCCVLIKIYPHTRTIFGKYTPNHSHLTGKDNLKYVQIHIPTLEQITGLIRLGLMDREIGCDIYIYISNLSDLDRRKRGCAPSLARMRGTITSQWKKFPVLERQLIERPLNLIQMMQPLPEFGSMILLPRGISQFTRVSKTYPLKGPASCTMSLCSVFN